MKKLRSGDLFQVPLPRELGFAYVQCVNLLEVNPDTRYPALIRIFNFRSSNHNPDIGNVSNRKEILCPLLIAGILPAINSGSWRFVDNQPLKEEDLVIPNYKRAEPNEENAKEWYYVENADITKKVKSTYENVRHLESLGATGSELVGTKIAMAIILDEGKKIEEYFELKEYFERKFFNDVTNIPPYYKQPKHMQGKALQNFS